MVKFDKKKNQKKVWLYKDKATGQPKGDGTVSAVRDVHLCTAKSFHAQHSPGLHADMRQPLCSLSRDSTALMQVTYEDPFSAASAVQWFDGKEFKGERDVSLTPLAVHYGALSHLLTPAGVSCA